MGVGPNDTVLNQQRMGRAFAEIATIAAAGGQLVPPNPKRTALIFCSSSAGSYTVSPVPGTGADRGMVVETLKAPLLLTLAEHGALVTMGFYVSAGTFPATITTLHSVVDAP